MSKRPVFSILENVSTQDGVPFSKVAEGDAVAAKNYGLGIVAKDPSNQAQFLKVNAAGELQVNAEGEDVIDLSGQGDNAGSVSQVTLFDVTLQVSKAYKNLEWVVSCFRDATFEIVHINDLGGGGETTTVLATIKVGAGAYTSTGKLTSRFTSGGSGTQVLRVRAANLNATSQLEAAASIQEVQV